MSRDCDELGIPNFAKISLKKGNECSKLPELQLLPFLSYQGKTNRGGGVNYHPLHPDYA